MWNQLPEKQKQKYRHLILGYAALTPAFAQKNDDERTLTPIIDSKFQETSFKDAFMATIEDIGNTSYDASVRTDINGKEKKFLVGIKTFRYSSNDQKVAQYKACLPEWSDIISTITKNGKSCRTVEETNHVNHDLYEQLALKICTLRNRKIESSKANLRGFQLKSDDDIESVYHVLMPCVNDEDIPTIVVGEISYDEIDINHLSVIGCTNKNKPANFRFTDGKHEYKFTAADSQLYMNFMNDQISQDEWSVKYLENADQVFIKIAEVLYDGKSNNLTASELVPDNLFSDTVSEDEKEEAPKITESYSWLLTDKNGNVPRYSGFNSFYGLSNKAKPEVRIKRVLNFKKKYSEVCSLTSLETLVDNLVEYLENPANANDERRSKEIERDKIMYYAQSIGNEELTSEVRKILYRPRQEVYIPIPNARVFHTEHPYFFGNRLAELKKNGRSLAKELPEDRSFDLVFEPSGQKMRAFIAEDTGKSIESLDRQDIMGKWLIEGVFQLDPYKPLTTQRLNELGINAIRLYKMENSDDVHLKFIWIDNENIPDDFIERKK